MIPYFLILLAVFIFSLYNVNDDKKSSQYFGFGFVIIVLSLFVGTRLNGPDYVNYEGYYDIMPYFWDYIKSPISYAFLNIEPLYILTNTIFRDIFNLDFQWFLLFFSAVFVLFTVPNIIRYSPYILVSLLLYYYYGLFSGFSAIRQVMAASIFFYSIRFIIEKKFKYYLLFIIIATLFHSTAIILLLLYFILHKFFSSRFVVVSLLFSFVLSQLKLFSFFIDAFMNVFNILPFLGNISNKIEGYSTSEINLIGSVTIEWLIIIIILIFNRKKLEEKFYYFNVFFNLFWIGLLIFAIASGLGDFGRLIIYFKYAYIIIIPMLISLLPIKVRPLTICLICTVVFVRIYVSIISDRNGENVNENRYIPYKSWMFR